MNREHIIEVAKKCGSTLPDDVFMFGPHALEAFAQQIRNEALKDAALERTCTWTNCDDDYMPGTWDGSCGAKWTFTEDGPAENSMKFCPECGGKVVIEKRKDSDHDSD